MNFLSLSVSVKTLLIILVVGFSVACQPEQVTPSKNKSENVQAQLRNPEEYDSLTPKGKIIPLIKAPTDSSESYCLLLPPDYHPGKAWPLILFFDPQGKPIVALEKYKNIAFRHGFILAGVNNSKNGQPIGRNFGLFDKIFPDLNNRFPLNPDGIITAGFSGGSKTALYLAGRKRQVMGTIGCSGSLEPEPMPSNPMYSLYGMGGNGDFNQAEMFSLGSLMKSKGFPVFVAGFQGKHEWPPVASMERAFEWMAVRINRKKNPEYLEAFIPKRDSLIKSFSGKQSLSDEASLIEESILLAESGEAVKNWKNRLEEIKKAATYQEEIKEQEKIRLEEKNRQNQYTIAFQDMDEAWWKNEITTLRGKSSPSTPAADLEKRLLGYLGILCYTFTTSAVNSTDEKAAEKFLNIYTFLEPENPEHRFLTAVNLARKGKTEEAFAQIQKAVQLGFSAKERLESEASFTTFSNQGRWINLLKSIK